MNDDIKFKIKTIIITMVSVLLVIIATIVISILLFSNKTIKYNKNTDYIDKNIIDIQDTSMQNNDVEKINVSSIAENIEAFDVNVEIKEEEKKLRKIINDKTYLFLKILVQFYNIDRKFCIDEIYEEKIDSTKVLYNIYYRTEENSTDIRRLNMFIKIDKKNKTFEYYPYEFVQRNKLLNMKEGEIIDFEGIKEEIEKQEENVFVDDDIDVDDETCMVDLFERFKFDLQFDLEQIYIRLDQNYKEARFKSFKEFENYANQNKDELYKDSFDKYKVYTLDEYKQFIAVSSNGRRYMFNAKNLMDYSIILDNYSIDTPEYVTLYQRSMPSVQAKYCIDRVRKAINDKNYEYVYEKLNFVQKHNYYKEYEDFSNFIKSNFFDKNVFTFSEYAMISNNLYQYDILVKDETLKSEENREFTMSVMIKENTDFYISIVRNK